MGEDVYSRSEQEHLSKQKIVQEQQTVVGGFLEVVQEQQTARRRRSTMLLHLGLVWFVDPNFWIKESLHTWWSK